MLREMSLEKLAQDYRNLASRRLGMIETRDKKIKEMEKEIKELKKKIKEMENSGYIHLEPTFETKA